MRTLPKKLAKDTVASTIVPSPPELPGSSRTPQLPGRAFLTVGARSTPAYCQRRRANGFRVRPWTVWRPPPRPCAVIDNAACPGVRPPQRGSAGDSRRAACRPLPRQSGAERVGKLTFPCLPNADGPNRGGPARHLDFFASTDLSRFVSEVYGVGGVEANPSVLWGGS